MVYYSQSIESSAKHLVTPWSLLATIFIEQFDWHILPHVLRLSQ